MGKRQGLNWSEADLADWERRRSGMPVLPDQLMAPPRKAPAAAPTVLDARPSAPPAQGMEAFYALGRMAKGDMNKTEAAYAQLLEAKKHAGEVLDWRFHPIRVRLADGTYYEPDFLVMTATRELQIHETKGGFTTDKGQLKIKLCAEVLPWFRVFKCTRGRDGWDIQEFTKR